MPYWLRHHDHGVMPVYNAGEVDKHKALGWALLNEGESPEGGTPPTSDDDSAQGDDHLRMIRDCVQPRRKPGPKPKVKWQS